MVQIHEVAESTKEATDEGAKVTTVSEGADATAAPPAEDKKSLLMSLGLPEEVADAAIASDGDGFKDGASRVSMFYSLKVNDDAKAEWKDHYLAYTKGAKASKGHISVSHTYNEETKEVICVESITGTDAMLNHIGNCLPHYAQMLGCGARGGVRVLGRFSRLTTLLYTGRYEGDHLCVRPDGSGVVEGVPLGLAGGEIHRHAQPLPLEGTSAISNIPQYDYQLGHASTTPTFVVAGGGALVRRATRPRMRASTTAAQREHART